MTKFLKIAAIGALFLGVGASPQAPWGGSLNRTTYLTFSGAVSLPGVQLAPGSYIFELANAETHANVVRVSSRDRSKVYLLAFTDFVSRPEGLRADQLVTLAEAPRGVAPPITAWFPAGFGDGRQFIYNK
jgi:hypothetical protein